MMDLFAQVAAAKAGSGARYPYINSLPVGDYELEVELLKRHTGVQDGLTKIIGEFKILKSSSPDPSATPETRIQAIFIPQKNAKAMPMVLTEIKEMVAAACQSGIDDLTKEDIEEAFSPENPTRGQTVGVKIYMKASGFKKVQFHTL